MGEGSHEALAQDLNQKGILMDEDNETQMYVVIFEQKGRMRPCEHRHPTSKEAFECVGEKEGLAIIEWQRDRRPQFSAFWTNPGLEHDEKLAYDIVAQKVEDHWNNRPTLGGKVVSLEVIAEWKAEHHSLCRDADEARELWYSMQREESRLFIERLRAL